MWKSTTPSFVFLKKYQHCLSKRKLMRERMGILQDEASDKKFCKRYYELFEQQMHKEFVRDFI